MGCMKCIGIDLGSSGAKGLLVSFPDGKILAQARASYPLHAQGNRAEQDPEDWLRATLHILETLGPADGIALTGMMHSEVVLDDPARSILWCDGRAEKECAEIVSKIGLEALRAIAGNRPYAGFALPHLLWRKKRGPVLICKDYARYRLTGIARQEASDAASFLCWDLAKAEWSRPMMEKLGLDPAWFAKPCGPTEQVGVWKGVPVFGGCSDNAAAAIGVGAVNEGDALLSLGTSNVILVTRNKPLIDPQMRVHSFPHGVPGKFYQMGCMLSGTRAFDWACKLFGVSPENAPIADDSKGLLFTPYLVGERTPHNNANLRATFAGIGIDHGPEHFLRAVLEGTAFAMREANEILGAKSLRVTGGGARNRRWLEICSGILGIPICETNRSEEGAAFGAAILAGVGLGTFSSVEAAVKACVQPLPAVALETSGLGAYERFRSLSNASRAISVIP